MSEVTAQKIASVQRSIARAREAFAMAGTDFKTNDNLQDAAILNVIRACDTSIDLANMLIRQRRLGIPNESRESFAILGRELIVPLELADRLRRMIGFRNLAVHQYRELDLDIVASIIRGGLDDLLQFAQLMRMASERPGPARSA